MLATAGSLPVAELARRLGADPRSLSHHLQPMRASEVIFCKRQGRQQHYDLTPGRVVFERFPAGGFSLTVRDHDGGVGVTIAVSAKGPGVVRE